MQKKPRGRETGARPAPKRAAAPPAPPKLAPRPAPPAALPAWVWKGAVAGAAILALALIVNQFPGDGGREAAVIPDARTTDPVDQRPAGNCRAIAGDWTWFTGGFVHFSDDGRAFFKLTAEAPPLVTATWTCDGSTGDYRVVWSHGFTDIVKLYDGDEVLQGTNNAGIEVSGKRYIDSAKGMPPLQTKQLGSQQIPINLPRLAEAAGGVAANWRPDAYLVGLRIRKDGWPNKDAFYVEMSFYSPSESTGLWVSTHRQSTKVREAGTVNWGTQRLPQRFVDLPDAVQTVQRAGFRGLVSRAELHMRERRGGDPVPVWDISPELHGQGAGQVDALTGALL